MSDQPDPDLKRLFAAAAEAPADEAFVEGVAARTLRERRIVLAGRALAGALFVAAVLATMASGLGMAVSQGVGVIGALVGGSPMGWAAGLALAFAGLVCVRALAPLIGQRRS